MQASLEKLRTDAAEAALIRDLTTDRRKAATFVFDRQKQTSAWQVGKVSKRGQRVPTGCDPLATETSQGPPLSALPQTAPTRGRFWRGC
jgi:hypothetical protein